MSTEDIHGQVSINSLDRYPWLTLHWHPGWHSSKLDQHSINTQSTSWSTVSWESTNFVSTHVSRLTLGRLLAYCWSSVNQVLIEMSIECRLSIYQDVDRVVGNWDVNYGLIKGIDWHLTTDAFRTHDPNDVELDVSFMPVLAFNDSY